MKSNLKFYVDKFIKENYSSISIKFITLKKVNEASNYDAMDIMHDVLLSLYYTDKEFDDYESFRQWAMKKFTKK